MRRLFHISEGFRFLRISCTVHVPDSFRFFSMFRIPSIISALRIARILSVFWR
jgi:hypothetical protein